MTPSLYGWLRSAVLPRSGVSVFRRHCAIQASASLRKPSKSSFPWGKTLLFGAPLVTAGGFSYAYATSNDDDPIRRLSLGPSVLIRQNRVHYRSAVRMRDLFLELSGLYLKAGQQVASMPHLLPREYTDTLAVCQDRANSMAFDDIATVFEEDMGEGALDSMFSSFNKEPVASASLAQVHHAVLRDGREFGWLVEEFKTHLPREMDFTVEAENGKRCAKLFHGKDTVHVPDVILAKKRILVMEFIHGCKVNDIDGLRKLGINRAEVSKRLSETIFEQIFVHGFVHCDPHPGNILVRPLPSKSAERKKLPQIVLLDHGLYRELTDDFRYTYAKLWKSLITGHEEGIREHSDALGAGGSFQLLSMMMTERSWEAARTGKLESDVSSDEESELKDIGARTAPEITQILGKLPRQMVLLFKCIDLLRGVDRDLQVAKGISKGSSDRQEEIAFSQVATSLVDQPETSSKVTSGHSQQSGTAKEKENVNTYLIMLTYCLRAIREQQRREEEDQRRQDLHGWFAPMYYAYHLYLEAKLRLSLLGVNAMIWFTKKSQ